MYDLTIEQIKKEIEQLKKKLACKYKSPEQKEMFQYQLDVLEEVLTF
jgi:hypothetical protein